MAIYIQSLSAHCTATRNHAISVVRIVLGTAQISLNLGFQHDLTNGAHCDLLATANGGTRLAFA